jgi:hypothetical protein
MLRDMSLTMSDNNLNNLGPTSQTGLYVQSQPVVVLHMAHHTSLLCHNNKNNSSYNTLTAQLALCVQCQPVVVLQQAATWYDVVIVVAAAEANTRQASSNAAVIASQHKPHKKQQAG